VSSSSKSTQRETTDKLAGKSKRKKRILFKFLTALISTLVCISVLFGIDLYLHYKHGVNLRGYRGPSLGRKQAGEKRVAILGGSTTWGFGLKAGQDFPAQLQTMLAQSPDALHAAPINVLNLGFNNDGAYSFKFTLKDYEYLEPDAILLYSGYNDLNEPNYFVYRHRSPLFVWTGYFPLLPSLTVDKLTVWKRQLAGQDNKTIFQPPDQKRIETSPRLQEQVGALTQNGQPNAQSSGATCPPEWEFYCHQIFETVALTLKQGKHIMVVTEPYISDKHLAQQQALRNMLVARFASDPNFRYLDLGRTVDLRDSSLCWDGMHLTEEGNRRIARAMVPAVTELLR